MGTLASERCSAARIPRRWRQPRGRARLTPREAAHTDRPVQTSRTPEDTMAFELPTLPYSTSALASKKMCQETLELHHGKHHQAYVTALNGFVAADPKLQGKSLDDIVKSTASTPGPVFNNRSEEH